MTSCTHTLGDERQPAPPADTEAGGERPAPHGRASRTSGPAGSPGPGRGPSRHVRHAGSWAAITPVLPGRENNGEQVEDRQPALGHLRAVACGDGRSSESVGSGPRTERTLTRRCQEPGARNGPQRSQRSVLRTPAGGPARSRASPPGPSRFSRCRADGGPPAARESPAAMAT